LRVKVEKGSVLGVIAGPLGISEYKVIAPEEGIVIGRTNLPLIHEGDALFHLAYYQHQVDMVLNQVEGFQEALESETVNLSPAKSASDWKTDWDQLV